MLFRAGWGGGVGPGLRTSHCCLWPERRERQTHRGCRLGRGPWGLRRAALNPTLSCPLLGPHPGRTTPLPVGFLGQSGRALVPPGPPSGEAGAIGRQELAPRVFLTPDLSCLHARKVGGGSSQERAWDKRFKVQGTGPAAHAQLDSHQLRWLSD